MKPETKTVLVKVTSADIAAGQHFHPFKCPVARAMRRTLKAPVAVTRAKRDGHWVGVATLPAVIVGDEEVTFRLSRAVGAFTIAFDSFQLVEPFAFRVVK